MNRVENKIYVEQLLKTVKNDKNKKMIKMHFGIDCEPYTLQEIGGEYHLTREMVRRNISNELVRIKKRA